MEANESKTQTPNLVGKVADMEKRNADLLRRISSLEQSRKQLEDNLAKLRAYIAQVEARMTANSRKTHI